MAILAAIGLVHVLKIFNLKKKGIVFLFIILVIPTNILVFSQYFDTEFEPDRFNSAPFFLAQDQLDAIEWLDNNYDNQVILAEPKLATYIPRLSDNKVYVSHWAQTIQYEDKLKEYKRFEKQKRKPKSIVQNSVR